MEGREREGRADIITFLGRGEREKIFLSPASPNQPPFHQTNSVGGKSATSKIGPILSLSQSQVVGASGVCRSGSLLDAPEKVETVSSCFFMQRPGTFSGRRGRRRERGTTKRGVSFYTNRHNLTHTHRAVRPQTGPNLYCIVCMTRERTNPRAIKPRVQEVKIGALPPLQRSPLLLPPFWPVAGLDRERERERERAKA